MQYFKQYGARRTGTNYLRALLELNFKQVTVLMHTLGGKHHAPLDLPQLQSNWPDEAYQFVSHATAAMPAENSLPFSTEQTEFMRLHAADLAKAVKERKLHFLISVKNPYAWVNSMLGNSIYANDSALHHELPDRVEKCCLEYNSLYQAYWNFYQAQPAQCSLVRYEDLLKRPEMFLTQWQQLLGLSASLPGWQTELSKALPTYWDHHKSTKYLGKSSFDSAYYLQEEYLKHLHPLMVQSLEQAIDWDLMEKYGYSKKIIS